MALGDLRFLLRAARRGLDAGAAAMLPRLAALRAGRPRRSPGSPSAEAVDWVRRHEQETGGIRVHSTSPTSYPEVTGYLVPTLIEIGETDLARRCLRWLLAVQRADGSFPDPNHARPHVFDTGQVLRGLLAGMDLEPAAREGARRAADYLCASMVEEGRGGFGNRYGGAIPESVHLYVLPPLAQASARLSEPSYRRLAERCLEHYVASADFLRVDDLTHFLAYELEALIDLGRADLARPLLDRMAGLQRPDGAVRGVGGAEWVCTPGLAQLAICWYKIGRTEPADRAMAWLEGHQRPGGGWLGSYGPGATYFPAVELSWAVKFYLDAHRYRARADRPDGAELGHATWIADVPAGRDLLYVGAAAPDALAALVAAQPERRAVAVDVSRPAGAPGAPAAGAVQAAFERLPLGDERFDVVVGADVLERASNPGAALRELLRVLRPGGWLLLRGRPGHRVRRELNRACDEVRAVGPAGRRGPVWRARKRSPLSGADWSKVLLGPEARQLLVGRLRRNELTAWAQEMILLTAPGTAVLEIGSGTGEISLAMARGGRRVTVSDLSQESLAFTLACAGELEVEVDAVCLDALARLPFVDGQFDCVWTAGLLEHFTREQRREVLLELGRVARGTVVVLVPNAAALAYRIGKDMLEESGRWRYGHEVPLLSLADEMRATGLVVEDEYSVAPAQALAFLPQRHPLRRALGDWLAGRSARELGSANQGYLLVTIGRVAPR